MLKSGIIFFIAAIIIISVVSFHRNSDWLTAMDLWSNAVKKSPKKARTHANVGLTYDKEGNLDKAKEEYDRAILLEPNYLAPYGPLAVIYGKRGDIDRAIRILSWMIPRLPQKDPKVFTALGVAYKIKGMLKEAETELKKALAINPHYDVAHYNLAQVYEQMGLKDEALEHYRRFIETAPPELKELAEKVKVKYGL